MLKTLKKAKEELEKAKIEVYARIVGYYRPISSWNKGKEREYKDRKVYENTEK